MSDALELARTNLAEGLQRRAQWHLSSQQWDKYLQAVGDLVTLYEHQNMTACRVAALMGEQGQDIAQWVELANYAQQNLVQAIEQAQTLTHQLAEREQQRELQQVTRVREDMFKRG